MYDRKVCLHDALYTPVVTSYPVCVYVPPTITVYGLGVCISEPPSVPVASHPWGVYLCSLTSLGCISVSPPPGVPPPGQWECMAWTPLCVASTLPPALTLLLVLGHTNGSLMHSYTSEGPVILLQTE